MLKTHGKFHESKKKCKWSRKLKVYRRVVLCHVIADTKAQFSDFKLGKKLLQFMRYEILKFVNQKYRKFEFDS